MHNPSVAAQTNTNLLKDTVATFDHISDDNAPHDLELVSRHSALVGYTSKCNNIDASHAKA